MLIEKKTTFLPVSYIDLNYSNGSPVRYTEVTETQKDQGVQTGKTTYYYDKTNNGFNPTYIKQWDDEGISKNTNMTISLSDWHVGTLDFIVYFKYDNGGYDWVKKKRYRYTKHELDEQIRVGLVFQKRIYFATSGSVHDSNYNGDEFESFYYGKSVGLMLLSGEDELWKEEGIQLVKTVNYFYDNLLHFQPTRTETTVSGGKTITNYTSYPQDYIPNGDFIANMVNNHMFSTPVENVSAISDGLGTRIISGHVTLFRSDDTGLPDKTFRLETAEPIALSAFKRSNQVLPGNNTRSVFGADQHYQQQLSFQYDVKGNVSLVQTLNQPAKSYRWGYNKTYPIAESTNADSTEFYVMDFEEAPGSSTGIAHTGTKYRSGMYTVNWNRPNSREYVISYWYRTSGEWKYSGELSYSGSSYTTTMGDAVDDIRIHPKDALLSTYTYLPMVGMGSMIDTKGQTSYYEYDELKRLTTVRDHQGNIVKQYCYNYAGQQQACFTIIPVEEEGIGTLYARVEIGSYSYSSGFNFNHTFGEAYVHFYRDAGCTQPYSLTGALEVKFGQDLYWYDDYQSGHSYYEHVYTAPGGSSSFYIGTVLVDGADLWGGYEPGQGPIWTDTHAEYKLVGHNNGYDAKPTYWE